MIIRSNEIPVQEITREGGTLLVRALRSGDEALDGHGRIFAHSTLMPGNAMDYHMHDGESETYYIIGGEGEYNDNGTLCNVSSGDVLVVRSGEGHGLRNTGTQPLDFVAIALYA